MISRRALMAGLALGPMAGCQTTTLTTEKLRTYQGPVVTRIQVFKEKRLMQLLHDRTLLKSYTFELGFTPVGHKAVVGDGRTPEGTYRINRKNPYSRYHLSLGISYPDADDIAHARRLGLSPGGDIFIHGTPSLYSSEDDWTWGCIAVTNAEIEEIYAMVDVGTIIAIYP